VFRRLKKNDASVMKLVDMGDSKFIVFIAIWHARY